MARVTNEDCLKRIGNQFKLVLIAAERARKLAHGSVDALVPWENHKSTVIALKEIAAGHVFESEALKESEAATESYRIEKNT